MTLEKNPTMNTTFLMLRRLALTVSRSSGTRYVWQPMSFASVRFGRDIDLPSNTRQQLSHMEAQLTAAEVLKPKDTDRSSSDGEDATLQPSTAHVADETDDALRRYAGAHA